MTTSTNSAQISLPVDDSITEKYESQFCCFRRGRSVLCRLTFSMIVCLAIVGAKSIFFDYYKNCDKSKHEIYWTRSVLISTFGFAVQVVIPYRLIIGSQLCKKLAILLWLLCVGIDAACRATVHYCDIPDGWERASTMIWGLANDGMSWVIVPLCLYFKLGICGLTGPYICTRVLLLVFAVLIAIGFDVARFLLSTKTSLYHWQLAIPRTISIIVMILIYVRRNMNTEPKVFISNAVNRIELVVLYNLLQGVLNDFSYILHATLVHADQFDFTIMDYKSSWIKVPIFFGYTVPMFGIAWIVQQLIKGRVDETIKQLLVFAFTFFQTYLTAMLVTSTERFEYGSLFTLYIIVVFKTSVIYVSLIDGLSKIYVLISSKCRRLCCKERTIHISDIELRSANSITLVENFQKNLQQKKTSRLFNPKHLASAHKCIAIDQIVERIAAVNCYLAAVIIFLAIHFYHPTAEGQLPGDRNTLITKASICFLWFAFESIISLMLIIFLTCFNIQLNSLRSQLYHLTSTTYLSVFILIILSYVTQTYRLWQ